MYVCLHVYLAVYVCICQYIRPSLSLSLECAACPKTNPGLAHYVFSKGGGVVPDLNFLEPPLCIVIIL